MKLDWLTPPDPRVTAAIDAGRPRSFWKGIQQGKIGRRDYFICLAILAVIYALSPRLIGEAIWMILFFGRAQDIGRSVWKILSVAIVLIEFLFVEWAINSLIETHGRQTAGFVMLGIIGAHICFAVCLGLQKPSSEEILPTPTSPD